MTDQEDIRRKSRRDLFLVLLILPLGVLCMFMTGQVAIRLAPDWVLNANMRSLLDPNAQYSAGGNQLFIEPLDPGILTLPAWGDLFLTPNALIPTRVIPTATPPPPPRTPPPPVRNTPVEEPEPTATTAGPIGVPTSNGLLSADLFIELSDNSGGYTPGTPINYTILVSNLGPDNAPRFDVVDNIPVVITGLTVNCSPAALCGRNTSSGNTVSFTGANLPYSGGANQITISISGTVVSRATGDLVNTAEIVVPTNARYGDPNLTNNTATDTDRQRSVHDLAITKSDGVGVSTYTATNPIIYTIVVTNSGPSDAFGISIRDYLPPPIASWTWTCVTLTNPTCNGVTSSTTFTDIVDVPSGGRLEYSVSASPAGIAQNISNTVDIIIPSGLTYTDPDLTNNTATDFDIPLIDLQVLKDDAVTTYEAGSMVTYSIHVTNNSTFDLTGISVSDPKPAQVTTWSWGCASGCTPVINSNTNFADTINLQAGGSLVYTTTANIIGIPGDSLIENLSNTVAVNVPAGLVDAVPGNNSATDTDVPNNPGPNLGNPDGNLFDLGDGGTITMVLSTPVTSDGGPTPDLVYYAGLSGANVLLDWALVEISSDHLGWSPVFFWGDNNPDMNTNVAINVIGGLEDDNRAFAPASLYNTSGVTIDIDSLGLSGSYPYIRITAPQIGGSFGSNDGLSVDSIQPYYP